jgi:ATP-dependent DNA helicase RecG
MYDIFFQPVKSIIPIKDTSEKALNRLGIFNIRDLVFYKPYSYNLIDTSPNLSALKDNTIIQTEVTILEILKSRSNRSPTKIYVANDTGGLFLVFFNPIPVFIFNKLKIGTKCIVCGNVQYFDDYPQITHPEFIFKKSLQVDVEPVYHLTYGLINKQLYNYILIAIRALELAIETRNKFGKIEQEVSHYISSLIQEIKQLHLIGHIPDQLRIKHTTDSSISKLATKELFANQLSLVKLKRKEQLAIGRSFNVAAQLKNKVLSDLGFELTTSQQDSINQIELDQQSSIQMMRLLQGDVGSGKTVVALLTMLNVAFSGAQSVLMAPTDLLSIQHYQFFSRALEGTDIIVALLTGKTKAKARKILKEYIENGTVNILIGTHALFQESVTFKDLGYIIIDEQHRFGVEQRLELIAKATHPDVLVMTATPIPRSLTLTMFGDMSLSVIKDKPKNRLPIVTTINSNNKRDQVIFSLQKIIDQDQKIYWVCPLIDQNDKTLEHEDGFAYADATARYEELDKAYPGQVGLLHGKIKAVDKDSIMQKFKDGVIKILVATTVIEVGIDVPDATLIVVENAEKFGLAQLHQLRGRVGRGVLQSYCILMYEPKRFSSNARNRLEIMRQSNDGFYIAEQDLLLRGGGEILGTKQSGEPEFFFADLRCDLSILLEANKLAQASNLSEFTEFQIRLFARDRQELFKSG